MASAATVSVHADTLGSNDRAPSRVIANFGAQSVSGDGPYKVDLGTNFSGWISIKMKNQSAGDVVTFQVSDNPAEIRRLGKKHLRLQGAARRKLFKTSSIMPLGDISRSGLEE